MLDALWWLSVKEIIYFNTLVMMYKIINNAVASYLCKLILYAYNIHNYRIIEI